MVEKGQAIRVSPMETEMAIGTNKVILEDVELKIDWEMAVHIQNLEDQMIYFT